MIAQYPPNSLNLMGMRTMPSDSGMLLGGIIKSGRRCQVIMKWAYRNLWSTIKRNNSDVSTFNPGGDMGRLVSTHEAPATPNVNPFLPVAKESEDGESRFLNFSPPGTERIRGVGVNK